MSPVTDVCDVDCIDGNDIDDEDDVCCNVADSLFFFSMSAAAAAINVLVVDPSNVAALSLL